MLHRGRLHDEHYRIRIRRSVYVIALTHRCVPSFSSGIAREILTYGDAPSTSFSLLS